MDAKRFNYLLKNIHDEKCFDEIYNEFYPIIIKFIMQQFPDFCVAKDIAHNIFTLFLQKEFNYIRNPKAYILKTARNLTLKHIQKYDERYLGELNENTLITEEFDIEENYELQNALKKLSPEEYDIIYKKWYLGLKLIEIAKEKNCKIATLRRRHKQILKKLKLFLKK